jgi:hypothetical protein
LLDGRRVLVFGDALSPLCDRLLERGARLVHVYDPHPERAAQAAARNRSGSIHIAPLEAGSLALRQGAFDVAIIENLAAMHDVAEAIKSIQEALSARGVALVACPNPEIKRHLLPEAELHTLALDYYALYDLVAAEFSNVRMLGQAPFVGYALVDFAPDEEPEPALDTGFVSGGSEEPEWFVALASRFALKLEDFSLIQVPAAAALEVVPAAQARPTRALKPTDSEHFRLRKELEQKEAWIAELETRAETADARADAVQDELEALQAEFEQLRAAPEPLAADSNLEQRLSELGTELEQTVQQRQRLEQQIGKLEKTLATREAKLEELTSVEDIAPADELAVLEAQLKDRAHQIRDLEAQLKNAKRVGHELIRELEKLRRLERKPIVSGPSPDAARLEQQLDDLARRDARAHADLEALGWTVAELERRLSESRQGPTVTGELARQLQHARAELQRQKTLLEQVRAERAAHGPVGAS